MKTKYRRDWLATSLADSPPLLKIPRKIMTTRSKWLLIIVAISVPILLELGQERNERKGGGTERQREWRLPLSVTGILGSHSPFIIGEFIIVVWSLRGTQFLFTFYLFLLCFLIWNSILHKLFNVQYEALLVPCSVLKQHLLGPPEKVHCLIWRKNVNE